VSLRWRAILVAAVVLGLAWFAGSNAADDETRVSHWYLPDTVMRLGLDLQGGIHWVLGVKLEAAIEHELDYLASQVKEDMDDGGPGVGTVKREGQELLIETPESKAADVRAAMRDWQQLEPSGSTAGWLRYRLTSDWQREVRENGMRQVLEVMRRRIEDPQTGIPESVVTRQGKDRILVQIPGGELERAQARKLLDQTGFLEFKIPLDQDRSEELLRARYPDGLPPETEIVFQRDRVTDRVQFAYLVPKKPDITGDYLKHAAVGFDNRGRPIVNFTWKPAGAEIFGKLTESHIDEPLAIIVDEEVYSAPTIRSRISTRGQIEGQFTSDEAGELAVILRAGALSVPVVIEEERTVGPALGADSISAGMKASLIGLLAVVFFAGVYYRLSGFYASVALLANLVMILGLMSMFGATLTLPGIAGLVLTVGMAIDANVIIFERIREELRAGKLPRGAIRTGFEKATWTILDANITTLITAVVLYEFGTGPIKGFAVTLSIGILTSVFAALVVTRLLFQLWPGDRPVEAVSI
jgi:preprotein translocase subunit SecD